ncbi:hypothetical protein AKO1_012862, partial [Acrasis kona]
FSWIAFFILLSLHIVFWLVSTGIYTAIDDKNLFAVSGCTINAAISGLALAPVGIYSILAIIFIILVFVFKMKDTYRVRTEMILSCIIYAVMGVTFVITQAIREYAVHVERYFPAVWIAVMGIAVDHICTCLFPCMATFINRKVHSNDTLESTLEDEDKRKELKLFAIKSFCGENILCWEDIQLYKNIIDHNERMDKAESMSKAYLRRDSPVELNLPDIEKFRKELDDCITHAHHSTSLQDAMRELDQLFIKLEVLVIYNMKDVFDRLALTKMSKS